MSYICPPHAAACDNNSVKPSKPDLAFRDYVFEFSKVFIKYGGVFRKIDRKRQLGEICEFCLNSEVVYLRIFQQLVLWFSTKHCDCAIKAS